MGRSPGSMTCNNPFESRFHSFCDVTRGFREKLKGAFHATRRSCPVLPDSVTSVLLPFWGSPTFSGWQSRTERHVRTIPWVHSFCGCVILRSVNARWCRSRSRTTRSTLVLPTLTKETMTKYMIQIIKLTIKRCSVLLRTFRAHLAIVASMGSMLCTWPRSANFSLNESLYSRLGRHVLTPQNPVYTHTPTKNSHADVPVKGVQRCARMCKDVQG